MLTRSPPLPRHQVEFLVPREESSGLINNTRERCAPLRCALALANALRDPAPPSRALRRPRTALTRARPAARSYDFTFNGILGPEAKQARPYRARRTHPPLRPLTLSFSFATP